MPDIERRPVVTIGHVVDNVVNVIIANAASSLV